MVDSTLKSLNTSHYLIVPPSHVAECGVRRESKIVYSVIRSFNSLDDLYLQACLTIVNYQNQKPNRKKKNKPL